MPQATTTPFAPLATTLTACLSLLSISAGCAHAPPPADKAAEPAVKPVIDAGDEAIAHARLSTYVARVLPGKIVEDAQVAKAVLKDARAFSEGHHHETWHLTVELDGRLASFALKIFPDAAHANSNAAQFRAAVAHDWPVPTEYDRGPAKPYSDRPALLMEFLSGGTLRTRVKRQFEREGAADTGAIAAAYGAVGAELGRLHKAHLRPRTEADRTRADALREMVKRCDKEGWCGEEAKARLGYLAGSVDTGPVTFVHGDLYEQQVIIGPSGGVRGFIDLDKAGFADPASDVGQLLAHVLLLNPRTREAAWSVANPTPEETRETAESFLSSYREAAGLSGDPEWQEFLKRTRGHMWHRFGEILTDLRGNPHGAPLIKIIEADKAAIADGDPLAEFKLSL